MGVDVTMIPKAGPVFEVTRELQAGPGATMGNYSCHLLFVPCRSAVPLLDSQETEIKDWCKIILQEG